MDEVTCADCGVPLVTKLGRWAQVINKEASQQWEFCCRVTYRMTPEGPFLEAADYHCIDKARQVHWTITPKRDDE